MVSIQEELVSGLILRDPALSVERNGGLRVFGIINGLKKERTLDSEVLKVKNLFGENISDLGNNFTEDCWQLLTVLYLFDVETAKHCVSTYLIAKNKVEKKLWNGIVLRDEFKKESVDLVQFYRACLLHDIGKIEVPHSVVVNNVPDEYCAKILLDHKDDVLLPFLKRKLGETYSLPDGLANNLDLLKYLYEVLHIRPQAIAPVKLLLDKPITKEITEQLAHCGCSVDDTLLKIIRTHDDYSRRILKSFGFDVEGELAGAHHGHKEKDIQYKITIGTMEVAVDLADIMHLADVENAITSKRHYKEEKTMLEAMKILVVHSKQGFVSSYVAYLWIADEIHNLKNLDLNDKDELDFESVTNFLEEERIKNPEWSDWRI